MRYRQALGYVQRSTAVTGVLDTAQKLFDKKMKDNDPNGYVDAPTLARIPVIGQSTWRSYFFVTNMNGDPVDLKKCPGTADYEVWFSERKMLR